jgi:hypothetical protein
MKKIILVICTIFSFISCATNDCVAVYMKTEREINNDQKTYGVLYERKGYPERILKIYSEIPYNSEIRQAKSFSKKDYDYLYAKHKYDTLPKFWKETDVKLFKLDTMLKHKNAYKNVDFKTQDEIVYYVISNPIFINKNHALFSYRKTHGPERTIDKYVVIMKRKNGKWMLFEKVYTDELH